MPAISTVTTTTSPMAENERARKRPSRLARLLGEVGHGLEAGVGEHREREREGEIAPVLSGREAEALGERLGREQEARCRARRAAPWTTRSSSATASEPTCSRVRRVSRTAAIAAITAQPTIASHGSSRSAVTEIASAEVVRDEERRERHDDEEVEEERPAGQESGEVVRRAPDEGRCASRLGNRGGALRVRERDDEEERAREQEHERREPERGGGDDAERDVQRGGDLAVGDGEQRRRVEHALEAAELTGHAVFLSRLSRPTPRATNRPPRRNPTTPPPCAAVATSSAIPIPTNATENASTAQEYSFTASPRRRRAPGRARASGRSRRSSRTRRSGSRSARDGASR